MRPGVTGFLIVSEMSSRTARNLGLGALALLATCGGVAGGIYALVSSMMRDSRLYHEAMARASSDERVVEALGAPLEPGVLMSGSMETSGSTTTADIHFPLTGPKGKGRLYLNGSDRDGELQFRVLEVRVGNERLDLREVPKPAPEGDDLLDASLRRLEELKKQQEQNDGRVR